jgi:prepilin-type N-terminal cleavage/methylation domain-containing protein
MTHATPAPRARSGRAGVTLIELLVVLSIIAILLSLTGAAVVKMRATSAANRTSEYATKLQKALTAEDERVRVKVRATDMPPYILAYADNNPQRAQAIYTALLQRQSFPMTFQEATTAAWIVQTAAGGYGLRLQSVPPNTAQVGSLLTGESVVYALQPLTHFAQVAGLTPTGNANEESGALLYIILSQQSASGGGAFAAAADDLTTAQKLYVSFGGTKKETYADGFGNALGFNRWDNGAALGVTTELQAPPYASAAGGNTDPLDPQGYCFGWQNATKQNEVKTLLQFAGQNRLLNVYSYGLDGKPGTFDDILGFRTTQPGNKGFHP